MSLRACWFDSSPRHHGDYGVMVNTAVCGTANLGSTPSSRPIIKNLSSKKIFLFAILINMKSLFNLFLLIALGFGVYGVFLNVPEGINIEGEEHQVPDWGVTFLEDRTYVDENGIRRSEQEIFDEIFRMIRNANNYILIDMFLYNDFLGNATSSYRPLSEELTSLLVSKKQNNPNIDIILITDPINEIYGGYESIQLNRLRDVGVEVVVTDLSKLRDSNPLYSAFYRAYLRWFENSTEEGGFANPFDARLPGLKWQSYAALLNFKANHRKVVLADSGNKFSVLITSANPHDGSSAHTNTAIRVNDYIWKEVLESELAVTKFTGVEISEPSQAFINSVVDSGGPVTVQLLTEEKIRDKIVEEINKMVAGDSIDIAMFYLSDRKVINAIRWAADRNADIRILLDPNKDAFGRKKNGVPNRPVAAELLRVPGGKIQVRFCDTHGEQCHTKFILTKTEGTKTLIQGSANLTRRNIGNYNLETNILVRGENPTAIVHAENYFEKVWANEPGKIYSTPYETYKDESTLKTLQYRAMEDLGTSSF